MREGGQAAPDSKHRRRIDSLGPAAVGFPETDIQAFSTVYGLGHVPPCKQDETAVGGNKGIALVIFRIDTVRKADRLPEFPVDHF